MIQRSDCFRVDLVACLGRWRTAAVCCAAVAITACGEPMSSPDARAPSDGGVDVSTVDSSSPVDSGVDSGVVVDSGVDTGAGCDRGMVRCGASCVALDSDPSNCGVCGNACPAGETCQMGACECPSAQRRCGATCVDTQSSAMNCGACGTACPSGQMCVRGACRVECPLPGLICGAGPTMQCVDATSDVNHCGRCDNACPAPTNATGACALGTCGLGMCNAGFDNCDMNPANGCEVNSRTDARNCGRCGTVCPPLANATASCAMGACGLGACNAGFDNCDANPANGCEINTNTNLANCGACGRACPTIPNGTPGCASGMCTVASCASGFLNCDSVATNGCETNINTSAANCGGCGRVCSGGATCMAGTCVVPSTTVTFPSSSSSVGVTPAGLLAGQPYFRAGDFVEETFSRATTTTAIDMNFQMRDITAGCAVAQSLSWNVMVNGAVVGSYTIPGGSGVVLRTITRTFAIPATTGLIRIRIQATTTVCTGGSNWNFIAGGTAVLR